jgi:acetyl-CoA carboxylase biotin carboxyl carrier protein
MRSVSVEYGQLLFRLTPVESLHNGAVAIGAAVAGQPAGENLAADTRAVVSPTDGVFYRKPSPDAAPFVEVGERIKRGQPVGLVEVMKTFNQILYDGPGFPDDAEVVEIRAVDAQEVGVGQILIVVR